MLEHRSNLVHVPKNGHRLQEHRTYRTHRTHQKHIRLEAEPMLQYCNALLWPYAKGKQSQLPIQLCFTDDANTSFSDNGSNPFQIICDVIVTCKGVEKEMKNLKPHKAAGLNDISQVLVN